MMSRGILKLKRPPSGIEWIDDDIMEGKLLLFK